MKQFFNIEQIMFDENNENDNFLINFEGDLYRISEGVQFVNSSSTFAEGVVEKSFKDLGGNKFGVTKSNKDSGIEVESVYEFFGDAIRQHNRVKNKGTEVKKLTNFSSALLKIPVDGVLSWRDERRFRVHFCKSGWSIENQWKTESLIGLGISPLRKYESGTVGYFTLRSEGSWSTGRYYPIIVIEDLEKGCTYFMEHEGGFSWEINVSVRGGKNGTCLDIECNSADIHHDGFCKKLSGSDEYVTSTAVYGKVEGGFEEAVKALTDYKRQTSLRKWSNNVTPVCYNVFMGAVYGDCTGKNIPPLVRAAADMGCEVFCIDAGWFRNEDNTVNYMGDYIPCDEHFAPYTLESILKMIKDSGMIPGLWFEFESCPDTAAYLKTDPNARLMRNGEVISKPSGFYDLTNESVYNYLMKAVDNAYKMGMRYIKNDYNKSTGIGFGDECCDYSLNNQKMCKAIYRFIDELYDKYPDIIIENCGSGAMRQDNGTLSHFHIQSTSDQEMYYSYAPIAAAAASLMPPEKAGNWAYPYFLGEDEYKDFDVGKETDFLIERNLDGEESIFAMINGMVGVLYMSGRIDYLDEKNYALVKEAVDTYKKIRPFISSSYAVYPTGMGTIGKREFVTVGLVNEEKTKMYLAVWKVDAPNDEIMIDLSKYIKDKATVKMVYPQKEEGCRFTYSDAAKRLTVKLEGNKFMARMFEITIKR